MSNKYTILKVKSIFYFIYILKVYNAKFQNLEEIKEKSLKIDSPFCFATNEQVFLREKRIKLLQLIDQFGSISKAAKNVPMTYKAAWDAIDAMNNLAEKPLVLTQTGGTRGGGSILSDYGKEMLQTYLICEAKYNQFLNSLNEILGDKNKNLKTLQRMTMQLSARNQIAGEIINIKRGIVNSEVFMQTKSMNVITATITTDSIENLDLQIGKSAVAIFKANAVLISKDLDVNISARNKFIGEIIHLTEGKVNSEIVVALGEDRIVSNITLESLKELEIKFGDKVLAIVKASNIMLGV